MRRVGKKYNFTFKIVRTLVGWLTSMMTYTCRRSGALEDHRDQKTMRARVFCPH